MSAESATLVTSLFTALRAEIVARQQAQIIDIQLTVTAVGALGAVAFTTAGDKRLLLLIPVVAAILGFAWFDNAENIKYLGSFIENKMQPAMQAAAGLPIPDWEMSVQSHAREKFVIIRTFVPPILVFVLTPIISILLAFQLINEAGRDALFWGLIIIDCLLICFLVILWIPYVV